MERCVYGESIAVDLLNDIGKKARRAIVSCVPNRVFSTHCHDAHAAWLGGKSCSTSVSSSGRAFDTRRHYVQVGDKRQTSLVGFYVCWVLGGGCSICYFAASSLHVMGVTVAKKVGWVSVGVFLSSRVCTRSLDKTQPWTHSLGLHVRHRQGHCSQTTT